MASYSFAPILWLQTYHPGDVVCLPNHGMPCSNGRGNLYIEISIDFPDASILDDTALKVSWIFNHCTFPFFSRMLAGSLDPLTDSRDNSTCQWWQRRPTPHAEFWSKSYQGDECHSGKPRSAELHPRCVDSNSKTLEIDPAIQAIHVSIKFIKPKKNN